MSQGYKITEEEINQTILHSPYSLVDSPAKAGLRAAQIKKYFYEFIRFFAEKLNVHLDDIDKTAEDLYKKFSELQSKDTELGTMVVEQIDSHNASQGAHSDIREDVKAQIRTHNTSLVAHNNIQKWIKTLQDKLNVTFAMVSAKQRIYPCDDACEVADLIMTGATLKPGDSILVLDPNECDFVVYESGVSLGVENTENTYDRQITYEEVVNGEVDFVPGKVYYLNKVRFLATHSTLETGLLAKAEDLRELEETVIKNEQETSQSLSAIEKDLQEREKQIEVVSTSGEVVTIETGKEYNLGKRASVVLEIGSELKEAIVNFYSGSTPTTVDLPSELYFSGDDTENGRIYPAPYRLYEINIKSVGGFLVGRVLATDLTIIEEEA